MSRPQESTAVIESTDAAITRAGNAAYKMVSDAEALAHFIKFEAARHRYLAMRYGPPSRRWVFILGDVLAAVFLGRIAGGAWFLVALLLTVGGCLKMAHGVEVPDQIVAGLVRVESGCEWVDVGEIRGKWKRGADGEVSAFQLSPAALHDMHVTNLDRVHRSPVYAESLARLWLSRCFDRCGNWPDAIAFYNGGKNYRSKRCRDYSARVLSTN